MNKEDLKKSTCINLRCVTQSSKEGVPLNQLQNDYRQLLGTPIPFKDLGYNSLEKFLLDIPDVICLKKNIDGSVIVEGVADASTAHIAKLISKQKASKKSKSGSAKPAVVARKWGSSAKIYSNRIVKNSLKECNDIPPRKQEQNSKLMHLTPAQQKLRMSVLINLRSVVQSCKDGVPLNRLQKDYRKFIGSNIPFENLGYNTLLEFIQSIPDVIYLIRDVNEQFIAVGVVDETTAHLFGNPLLPKPVKTVSPPNEFSKLSGINSAAHQSCSERKAESPSFFKLPPNGVDLSNISCILKCSPAVENERGKNVLSNPLPEVPPKNLENHESKEKLIRPEPLKAAKPDINCKENSASEIPLLKTDKTSCQDRNKILETIQDQIQNASLGPLVWMHFILYGPSTMKTLRKKVLSFYGFPFSTDSKQWKEKVNLVSLFPKKALQHCLFLLGVQYDPMDSKANLQHKLIDFFAAYTEESETNMQETKQKESEGELYASTTTLASVSSDILSKCSSDVGTESSDAISMENVVAPKIKCTVVSDSDSDIMELPLNKQSPLKNGLCSLKEKELVHSSHLNDKEHHNLHFKTCEGIQSEKVFHSSSTNTVLQKPSIAVEMTPASQQPFVKNVGEQTVDIEDCSKTETSSVASSKSAKKRRRKKKKSENTQENTESSVKKNQLRLLCQNGNIS